MKKVAFQGTLGSYSEQALNNFFDLTKHMASPFDHSQEVVKAIMDDQAHYGILPVENSIVGNVTLNIDLIYQYDLYASHEIYFNIDHCLLGLPGSKLDDIKTVMSHPIALSQCSTFLSKRKISKIPSYDTAGSGLILSQDRTEKMGVIASSLAAKYYDLKILRRNIANTKNNFTRFLIISHKDNFIDKKTNKMSLAFTTKHNPGALIDALNEFKRHKLNLTKIESRPIKEKPFQYRFFVDFLGYHKDDNVIECLEKLASHTLEIKIIGSYQSAQAPLLGGA